MAMTKKNYVAIAEVVASVEDWDTRNQLMVDLGRVFEADNDRFDFWMFKGHVHGARAKLMNEE